MLSTAMGSYILATPSDDGVDTMNGDQGIWYLSMPGPMAGLTGLPDLGASWTYEGWIVDVSGAMPVPYSTGTFDAADMADSDAFPTGVAEFGEALPAEEMGWGDVKSLFR